MTESVSVLDSGVDRRWNEWTAEEVHKMLTVAIKSGFRRTIFIWGQRGIGKSALVHQAVEDCGGVLIDRRLSMMDPADVRGVLMAKNAEDQKRVDAAAEDATITVSAGASDLAVWLANPDFFPKLKKGQKLVIFLDEFNHAPDLVQKAAYEIAWDHSVAGRSFPDGTVVILAGNRETENANVTPLDKPMRRRAIHVYMRYDYKSYFDWAETRLHPSVIHYHRKHPEVVNRPVDSDTVEYFGEELPASWEVVSDILRTFPGDMERKKLIAGQIGVGASIEFDKWLKVESELEPLIDAIMAGENKTAEMVDQQYFVMQTLAEKFRHDRKVAGRVLDYAKFCKAQYAEIASLMLTTLRKIDLRTLQACPNFKDAMREFYDILC